MTTASLRWKQIEQPCEVMAVQPYAKGNIMESYLQEGLLAVVPVYEDDVKAAVLTLAARHSEKRSVTWLVKRIAALYSLDMTALRRRCGALLSLKQNISLAVNENLVLLPVRVRQALQTGEGTIGYVCLGQIEALLPLADEEEAPFRARVIFRGQGELKTLNSLETLNLRLRQGEIVRVDARQRNAGAAGFNGLSRQALAEQLPNCDCLLRDIFIERFGLDPKRGE